MSPKRRQPGLLGWALLSVLLLWLSVLLVLPFGALLSSVLSAPGQVWDTLTASRTVQALGLTLGTAAVCVVVNAVVGVLGGLVLVRQRFWGRAALDALVDLPLALSPVMTGLGLLLLFGRSGVFYPALQAMNLSVAFAWPAVVLATLFVTLPFATREVALILRELGDSEEQAAATLGAGPWRIFWRVTLPKLRVGLGAGLVLTLARALGEFGAVLVVGGGIAGRTETATTFIHAALEGREEPAAYGMALLLAALCLLPIGVLTLRGER